MIFKIQLSHKINITPAINICQTPTRYEIPRKIKNYFYHVNSKSPPHLSLREKLVQQTDPEILKH